MASLAVVCNLSYGQLQVNTGMTPVELVEQVLVGSCVEVSNISYNGVLNPTNYPDGIAGFANGGATNLGLGEGIILSSGPPGLIANPASTQQSGQNSPNNTTDPDLQVITGGNINDAAILEFDFVPNGDSISFRFVFGSEEYPEFVCSFNDAFGFFLSGPGISGPYTNNAINIALIPGTTTPVSINNVNNGLNNNPNDAFCPAENPEYYIDNTGGATIVYDGFTTVLTAKAAVQCDSTYHIKLAIADALDQGWDSGVFLEAGSFSSVPFVPTLAPGPMIAGSTIYESCLPLTMQIRRTSCDQNATEVVYMNYGGTATMGDDITPVFPDSLIFEPGVTSLSIDFFAPLDPDGPETFIIEMQTLDCLGELATSSFTFIIDQAPGLEITGENFIIDCDQSVDLVAVVTGGFGEYEYDWSNGETTPTITVTPTETTTYTVVITDGCGETISASYQVFITPPVPLNMNLIGPSTLIEGCESTQINFLRPLGTTGVIVVEITPAGSAENNSDFILPGSITIPEGNFNILLPFEPLSDDQAEGEEVVVVTGSFTDDCGRTVTASVTITIVDAPAIFITGNDYFVECGLDSLLVSVDASGGYNNDLTITWDGEGIVTGTSVYIPLQTSGSYQVTATDPCGQTAMTTVNVVVNCEILVPNVFTPNGDGLNDLWEIEGIQYTTNNLRVFNRWGQVVYEARNYRNSWRASDIPDGTYFYEIIVERHEKPYTGHVTILRN